VLIIFFFQELNDLLPCDLSTDQEFINIELEKQNYTPAFLLNENNKCNVSILYKKLKLDLIIFYSINISLNLLKKINQIMQIFDDDITLLLSFPREFFLPDFTFNLSKCTFTVITELSVNIHNHQHDCKAPILHLEFSNTTIALKCYQM
jgi:hypothetical protein